MEYPYIDLIPAIIKSHMPSVYEGESFTSLEYISKVAHKMNEVVDEFNSFVNSIVDEVTTYKDCTDKDSELFKRVMEQKFQDFINVITLKYQSQDLAIQSAVAEIIASLPAKLQDAIDEMYKSGEFDQIVYKSIENLKNDFDRIVNNMNTFQNNITASFSNTLTDIEGFKSEINTDFNNLEENLNQKFNDLVLDAQTADMQKAIYDMNNNGVVDDAEKLGGYLPEYYAKQQDLETSNENINTLNATITATVSQVATVQNTANTAKTIAEEAKASVDSNALKVDNAISLANVAQTTADNAQTTADNIDANHNLRTYTNITRLGLTNTTSISELCNAMPIGSVFYSDAYTFTDSSWNFPSIYGYFELSKIANSRYQLRLISKTDCKIWLSNTDNQTGIPTGEWVEIITSGNNGMNLLWTNASPTSDFAGKTLNLNVKDYKFFLIVTCRNKTSTSAGTTFIIPNISGFTYDMYAFDVLSTTSTYGLIRRCVRVNSTSVIFEDCFKSGTTSNYNSSLIPFKIYGIK